MVLAGMGQPGENKDVESAGGMLGQREEKGPFGEKQGWHGQTPESEKSTKNHARYMDGKLVSW